jgi:predicted metal-dependent HD superfamily phosphohydrolase
VIPIPPEIASALGKPLLDAAQAAYTSPGRHYHTWTHIEACLREAAALRFDDPFPVYAALLFHDAIYVAGAKDNEARSADLATAQLRARTAATSAQFARVEHLILLTASHGTLPAQAPRDDKLLIDIDLSILATTPADYANYAAQVRDEWVPGVVTARQYATGRTAFLRGMLAAPRVFHSEEFSARESAARDNIAGELRMLEGAS